MEIMVHPIADMFVLICKSCCFMSPNERMEPVSLYFLDKIDILVDVYMISIILSYILIQNLIKIE